jgi:hypothetical protein
MRSPQQTMVAMPLGRLEPGWQAASPLPPPGPGPMHRLRRCLVCVVLLLPFGCAGGSEVEPDAVITDTTGSAEQPDRTDLHDGLVPLAVAGQPGWEYSRAVAADLDGDGREERAVLISNAEVHGGRPFWEDGHHWQMYIETAEGERTHAYSRFVPHGMVDAWLTEAEPGEAPRILLMERTPHRVAVYAFEYRGPDQVHVTQRFVYDLDVGRRFIGTPNE